MVIQKSIEHLKENNMGYYAHLRFAFGHGLNCIKAGILLVIHSIVPGWFARTGSILVSKLNKSFTDHKNESKK